MNIEETKNRDHVILIVNEDSVELLGPFHKSTARVERMKARAELFVLECVISGRKGKCRNRSNKPSNRKEYAILGTKSQKLLLENITSSGNILIYSDCIVKKKRYEWIKGPYSPEIGHRRVNDDNVRCGLVIQNVLVFK